MKLGLVQQGLEALYRIDTALAVDDFVIDTATRDAIAPHRAPREQLLVHEQDGELSLALFVDERSLANLVANDPRERLDDSNFQDFLYAIEGVSHFVYVAWRARAGRSVSVLELELQAEVDKWVACLTTLWREGAPPADLIARLFDRFQLEPGLDAVERERYLVANENARTYTRALGDRFVAQGRIAELFTELRRFYRMSGAAKLEHVGRIAA